MLEKKSDNMKNNALFCVWLEKKLPFSQLLKYNNLMKLYHFIKYKLNKALNEPSVGDMFEKCIHC